MTTILALFIWFLPTIILASNPLVNTPFGEVEGFTYTLGSGKDMNIFLGIRYGKAPDSIYRFEKPQPVEKWAPFRHQATKFRASCIPLHRDALIKENYSEDCLFLNIVTPALKPSVLLPVLVFIHGGGFEIGDAETYGYKNAAENFASEGIVFVTINYRLGPLGFFTTGDNIIPGNMGLWDQTLALMFLNEILPSFGGDPNRITLSGHSAGASSVSALLFSPHSDHLFQQAIEMSGSIFAEYAMGEDVIKESRALADAVGCTMTDSYQVRTCMKEKTMDEILDGVDKIGSTRRHVNSIKFHPHFDKDFFSYEVEHMARKAPKKKTMQGVTNMESATFAFQKGIDHLIGKIRVCESRWGNFSREDLLDFITAGVVTEDEFGGKRDSFLHLLEEFYINRDIPDKPDSKFFLQRYIELLSDLQFNIPVYHEIDLKRMNGWETYYYVIEHESNPFVDKDVPVKGSFHTAELRFLFEYYGLENIPNDENDTLFKKHILRSFINFIKNGNPSTSDFTWDPVTIDHPGINIRLKAHPEKSPSFRASAVEFWLKTVPDTIGAYVLHKSRLPAAQAHIKHTEL